MTSTRSSRTHSTSNVWFNRFFFVVLGVVLYSAGHLFAPFFGALLGAGVLAIVFYPMHLRIGRWRRIAHRPALHAFLSDLAVLFLFLFPLALLVWALSAQLNSQLPELQSRMNSLIRWLTQHSTRSIPGFHYLPEWLAKPLDFSSADLQTQWSGRVGGWLTRGAQLGTLALQSIAEILLDMFLLLFALFFLFLDGESWYLTWNKLLPLNQQTKDRVDRRLRTTVSGVVRGTFLTSLAQAVTAGIGFAIVGAKPAILLGTVTFVTSLVPSIGTALVWAPVSLFFLVSGSYWRGLFMLAWGIFVVGVIDNLVRPLVVGEKADIPFFWLFFGILGGLKWYGVKGLLIGPIIIALAGVLLEIYEENYINPSG